MVVLSSGPWLDLSGGVTLPTILVVALMRTSDQLGEQRDENDVARVEGAVGAAVRLERKLPEDRTA